MAPLPRPEAPPESAALAPSASVPCSCLPSPSAAHRPAPRRQAPPDPAAIARHVVSAAERLASAFSSAASSNPFIRAVSSASGDLRRFFETQCRFPKGQLYCGSSMSNLKFAAILPGDSIAGLVVANGLSNFFNIYNALLLARLLLTWFPGAPAAIVSPLSTLCDPYLNIFRGIIPPLGGTLDLSPILAFLVLDAFTGAAAALPAELPEQLKSQQHFSSCMLMNLTTVQEKWSKRVCSRMKQEKPSD